MYCTKYSKIMQPFSMYLLCFTMMIITTHASQDASENQVPFNLSLATCYLPEEKAKLDIFGEWSSHMNEGYCYDYLGNGFAVNQTILGCQSCMVYTCKSQHCKDRGGDVYKSWWELTSVEDHCCHDCEGRVIPPNKVTTKKVPTDHSCHSIKKSSCTLGPKQEGELVVTFESMHCCVDPNGMEPVGTKVLEPSTCSERTCQEGSPASWFERPVLPGCNCCFLNGSLIENEHYAKCRGILLKCCKGELLEKEEQSLEHCLVKNLAYLIDTSGSMGGSKKSTWLRVALGLEKELNNHTVTIEEYTLMHYVTSVKVELRTPNRNEFETAINITSFGGSRELTFAGLKAALELVDHFSFIVLFSDEVGDDTTNDTLKNEIINLRDSTSSTIVFMMIPSNEHTWNQMVANFQEIGSVYDIKNNPNATQEVLQSIRFAAICTGITSPGTGPLKDLCVGPSTMSMPTPATSAFTASTTNAYSIATIAS